MTLTVTIEPGVVPRVILSGGTPGQSVVGVSQGGARWTVVEGMASYPIVDPVAPLETVFWYEHAGETTQPAFRESRVYNAFTSLDGSTVVPFIMPHEWSQKVDTGLSVIRAGGQLWWMYPKDVDEGTYPVQARIAGENIPAMRAILSTQTPFVFLHGKCPLPDCHVPPALTVVTASAGLSTTARKDRAEQTFQLDLQPITVNSLVPARTWWHTAAENDSWLGVDLIAEAFK
ncbi:hypothetical protein [Flaviflexus massiliensis]|uniref:hypothetical protein n=1 Tax=Flaviflexus massiliensis TaxID=1522309 RepID=UPI0011C804CC|nr:hypothetical protein [Flaviflexus massiliensis]